VAVLTEKRSAVRARRRACRPSSDERRATDAQQDRRRFVTALQLQSSAQRKVEPKLSTQGLSLSLESLHDVCAKVKLSHFQLLVDYSVIDKPGSLMFVA
jgi:hypothetical protein